MELKTLNDLLDLAITVEQGSQAFYKTAMQHATDDKTKYFLKELYEEEVGHERALASLKDSELYIGDTPIPEGTSFGLEKSHSLSLAEIPKEITYATIAKAALQREAYAIQLFEGLSKLDLPKEFHDLFCNLLEEEKRHHQQMETLGAIKDGSAGNEM